MKFIQVTVKKKDGKVEEKKILPTNPLRPALSRPVEKHRVVEKRINISSGEDACLTYN